MPGCTLCGGPVPVRSGAGRPRRRCDGCRTSIEKIDGTRWRRVRAQVLSGNPRCVVSECFEPATEVDHIIALANGGDPYDLWNLQPMCKPHNAAKGARTAQDRNDVTSLEW